jgi:hypothetical protein
VRPGGLCGDSGSASTERFGSHSFPIKARAHLSTFSSKKRRHTKKKNLKSRLKQAAEAKAEADADAAEAEADATEADATEAAEEEEDMHVLISHIRSSLVLSRCNDTDG